MTINIYHLKTTYVIVIVLTNFLKNT